MHELSVANSIVEIVASHPAVVRAPAVRSVRLRVGEAAGVVPASLEFCFRGLTEGTKLEGAALEIERVPFTLYCRNCESELRSDPSLMLCPACGSAEVRAAGGFELEVVSVDVAHPEEVSA
jgi:hydrogenase nickel incorporation protein HypA/HybF